MVTDILRSHHLVPTQILSDSGQQTWIRYYPSAPGARAYPGWHAFGDPVWESDFPTPDGVGCYPAPLIWRGKRYPAPPGQHYRGLPEWFQHGLPTADLSAEPISDTCTAPAISAQGGVVIGGTAWPTVPVVGLHPCCCASPSTTVVTPGVVTSAPCLCAEPVTGVAIPGVVTSAPCLCSEPATEVTVPIQSCLTQTLTVGLANDLVLKPTVTPITKYDLTAASGGTIITGIVPQTLPTGPQWIELVNVGVDPITIDSASGSSLAPNRIQLPPTYVNTVALAQWDTITLSYDPCGPVAQWVVQACTVDVDESLAEILAYILAHLPPPTLTTVAGELRASYTTTAIRADTGCQPLVLPPGTWLISYTADAQAHAQILPTQLPLSTDVQIVLFDVTANAFVPDSLVEIMDFQDPTGVLRDVNYETGSGVVSYTVTVTTTIKLYAASQSTTNSTTAIYGDAVNTPTRMVAVRTAP